MAYDNVQLCCVATLEKKNEYNNIALKHATVMYRQEKGKGMVLKS